MPSNRTSFRDETDYVHFSPGATGLHHLHSHRPAVPSDRSSSGALALDLPPFRVAAGRSSKTDNAARSQVYGILLLLVVAALLGSYSPVLKFLFSQPTPPSAALMTAAQALLAAAFLLMGTLGGTSSSASSSSSSSTSSSSAAATAAAKRGAKPAGAATAAAPPPTAGRAKSAAYLGHVLRVNVALGLNRVVSQLHSLMRLGETAWRRVAAIRILGWWGGRRRGTRREGQHALHGSGPLWQHLDGPGSSGDRGAAETSTERDERKRQQQRAVENGEHAVSCGTEIHTTSAAASAAVSAGRDGVPAGGGGGGGGDMSSLNKPPEQGLLAPRRSGSEGTAGVSPMLSGVSAAVSSLTPSESVGGPSGGPTPSSRWFRSANPLSTPWTSLAAVGVELGTYSFCAAALGAWGVQRISATKVAFLGQASSLITPVLVALSGQRVALVVWGACGLGVLGAALVALDGSTSRAAAVAVAVAAANSGDVAAGGNGLEAAGAAALGGLTVATADGGGGSGGGRGYMGGSRAMRLESTGTDGGVAVEAQLPPGMGWSRSSLAPALSAESMGANYVIASCLFYALGTVRLGVHSGRFAPLDLAAASALVYAVLAMIWLLVEVLGTPNGASSDYAVALLLLRDNVTLTLLLWAGFGPGALSSYLQVLGQRIVPPAQAQMLYSSAPFWSALIAKILLRGRDGAMGPLAWLGGTVMLSASLVASLLEATQPRKSAPLGGLVRAGPGSSSAVVAAVQAVHDEHKGGGGGPGVGTGAGLVSLASRWSGGGAGLHHRDAESRDRDL
ncbi:hypothetical protein Vafri_8694 [Volvox africanus]|uniref:EamA domain-containing protein n=1 Tax=Volvox africanus TaxID=51714 RepID=A0A8J4F0K8_9CHLO|nr:hypothetical protein Vafri_8694 [Volvox africanus]